MTDHDALLRDLERADQGQISEHLGTLTDDARARLIRQLSAFDWQLVRELARLVKEQALGPEVAEFEPAPVVPLSRPAEAVAEARRTGEAAIREGTVAAFVVAGGQGSRLRFDGPKGCYRIGSISGKSLFQIHAERVLAAGRRYGAEIPLYVMTSETNDAQVREFFEQNEFFALPAEDVAFCTQRVLPAFDAEGRLFLDAPDHVFVSPDGHGGSYRALQSSGALDDMARRGVRHISYFQVDNPMVPAIDPVFIGEHVRTGSEMSSKVLKKREPREKLGVFANIDGALRVVEYSEMDDALQRKTLPDGSLKYAFGSIAVHAIDIDFARRMASTDLPFHVAHKAIPVRGEGGGAAEPGEPNGFKLERFVFDGIRHARNPLVMEVRREDEFAPVKNFDGDDSPASARAAMVAQHRRWLRQAGVDVPERGVVEISPLFALDAEELKGKVSQLPVSDKLYLE